MKKQTSRTFASPDGTNWQVKVESPGASNAILYFRHPDGRSTRLDRYNWIINQGPEARSVTARLDKQKVLADLPESEISRLFSRSMPVSRQDPMNGPEPVAG